MLASKTVRGRAICCASIASSISLALAFVASSARAEDCKPAAVTRGDPAIVHSLSARLAALGVATEPVPGCPAVQVQVEQRGDQLHLALADAFQRTSERDVRDVATAAAVVESWTYQVVDAGTLPAEAPAAVDTTLPVARYAYRGVSASATSMLLSDGTTWVGGALGACLRAGPFCAGASLRGEVDTAATGPSSTFAQDSYALSVLATLDWPRPVGGGFTITPGIGVGYGYLHVTAHHHDAMNNPLDQILADHSLRAGAHVAVLRPLAAHWSWFADLWGEAAPVRSNGAVGGAAAVRLGVGLRLEAP